MLRSLGHSGLLNPHLPCDSPCRSFVRRQEQEERCVISLSCGHVFHLECAESWLHLQSDATGTLSLLVDLVVRGAGMLAHVTELSCLGRPHSSVHHVPTVVPKLQMGYCPTPSHTRLHLRPNREAAGHMTVPGAPSSVTEDQVRSFILFLATVVLSGGVVGRNLGPLPAQLPDHEPDSSL